MANLIRGIVPPLVTPLLDRDTIDVEGTKRLIDHVIDGGVAGIFILGTTGEAPSLSYRLRREFIELACRCVDQRESIDAVATTWTRMPTPIQEFSWYACNICEQLDCASRGRSLHF